MEQEPRSTRIDPIGCAGILLLVVIFAILGGAVLSSRLDESVAEADALPAVENNDFETGTIAIDALSQAAPNQPLTTAPAAVPNPSVVTQSAPMNEGDSGSSTSTAPLAALPPASPTPPPTVAAPSTVEAVVPAATSEPVTDVVATATTGSSLTEAPLPTPPGVYSWTLKVPILMYHYLSTPPADADIYRVDLSVSPESFREQLTYLKDNGYTTIDFYDLSRAITNQTELPEKSIILTFDDGYIDNYENAFPLLVEHGFKATFFIVTDFVDKGRAEYMTWDMIKEMAAAGMRMESHSRNHPDLRTLSRDGLIWELRGSQETLAAHINYTPRFHAYPGGTYDEETIQILDELQFWGAVTTRGGTWHGFNDRFEWRRLRVRYTTTLAEFATLVDLEGTSSGKTIQ